MLVCGASAIVTLGRIAQIELQYLNESTNPEEFQKEAPAPLATGLLRMRRGGASVDIRHLRDFSLSRPTHGYSRT